jgi:integrase
MLKVLDRLGLADETVHGMRSSFRDWAEEQTSFPSIVAELALGHTVGDGTERAYRRTDLFDRRRKLMEAWARFCTNPTAPAEIVPLHAAG